MREFLRRVTFRPYRPGLGPSFTLSLYDTHERHDNKWRLAYKLTLCDPAHMSARNQLVFSGRDFFCSPLHAVDSDETVAAIMNFLTLRPGDTDPEYFDNYKPHQVRFCEQHAEYLAAEVENRFGAKC